MKSSAVNEAETALTNALNTKYKCLIAVFSQIWYYTNGILREAGFAESILPYITLSTGAVETLAAVVSVSIPAVY